MQERPLFSYCRRKTESSTSRIENRKSQSQREAKTLLKSSCSRNGMFGKHISKTECVSTLMKSISSQIVTSSSYLIGWRMSASTGPLVDVVGTILKSLFGIQKMNQKSLCLLQEIMFSPGARTHPTIAVYSIEKPVKIWVHLMI